MCRRHLLVLAGGMLATLGFAQTHLNPITIRFACSSSGKNLARLQRPVRQIEALNPDIHVKVEPIVDNYDNKLLSMLAAEVQPDAAYLNPNRFIMFAGKGALIPLDNFPDLHGPEVDLAGRYQNLVKAFQFQGKQYAIPRDVACSAYIFYNKLAFDRAGIPYPDGSWTWDTKVRPELREKDFGWVMDRLTIKDPDRSQPKQYAFTSSWPQLFMESLLASSNVQMWDSDEHPTKLYLDNPMAVEVFRFASDCFNKYHWIPSNNDISLGAGSTMQDEFRKGHIAMLESGAWDIQDMRLKHTGEWDIAPFPRFARANSDYLPGEGAGAAMFRGTKYPEQTWKWIKYYTGVRALTEMAHDGESQPSIRRLAITPGIWLPAKGATGPDAMPAHLAISDEVAQRVRNRQLPDYFSGIANDIQGTYYGVLTGEKEPGTALADLQRDEPKRLALELSRVNGSAFPTKPAFAIAVLIVAGIVGWVFWPERNLKRTRNEKSENRSGFLFIAPWIVGIAFTIGPMLYSLILSFAASDIIQPPTWRGLGNYADALNPTVDDTLFVSLRQTFIFTALSIPIGLSASLALALLLNQKVRGVPIFRALYYLPSLASAVAMSLIWMRMFDRDKGIINAILYGGDGKSGFLHIGPVLSNWIGTPGEPINWLGNSHTVIPAFIIMGLWGAGAGTVILLAGLQGIPEMYFEAATLDGATAFQKFRKITLPLLSPTLFFSLITGFIGALQVFSQAFVITGGGPDRATMFYMVWLYQKAFGELRMGYASALAWILFVIIMAGTAIQLTLAKRWVHYEGEIK